MWLCRSQKLPLSLLRKKKKFKTKVNVLSKNEIENSEKGKYVITEKRHTVELLLDTGNTISIVNEQTWKKIGCPPLRSTKKSLEVYLGKKTKFHCKYHL